MTRTSLTPPNWVQSSRCQFYSSKVKMGFIFCMCVRVHASAVSNVFGQLYHGIHHSYHYHFMWAYPCDVNACDHVTVCHMCTCMSASDSFILSFSPSLSLPDFSPRHTNTHTTITPYTNWQAYVEIAWVHVTVSHVCTCMCASDSFFFSLSLSVSFWTDKFSLNTTHKLTGLRGNTNSKTTRRNSTRPFSKLQVASRRF